jgi:hypothetical protein
MRAGSTPSCCTSSSTAGTATATSRPSACNRAATPPTTTPSIETSRPWPRPSTPSSSACRPGVKQEPESPAKPRKPSPKLSPAQKMVYKGKPSWNHQPKRDWDGLDVAPAPVDPPHLAAPTGDDADAPPIAGGED